MLINGFDWDSANWPKCAKHRLHQAEIEAVFARHPGIYADARHPSAEQLLRAIGTNEAGRHILVAFTLRLKNGNILIRPISARYMHQKEIDRYEQDNPEA